MATSKQVQDEIISVDEITVSPRGRKKVIDSGLADKLAAIKPGQAAALRGTFGAVPAEQRAKVSQVIRKHWEHVRSDVCRINYSPEGVPQVSIKA